MNRSDGSKPLLSEPLPDAPWPVAARSLLSPREQSLYQRLLSLYPKHQVFVQVALSQLIDVDRNHPESESIRARYKQLVADFVLCRADLSVVAVIELDDRSHERRDRQDADARKSKALADAGLRLVRIPAGALPSEEELREIIDADRPPGEHSASPKMNRFVPVEPELRLVDDWGSAQTDAPGVDHDRAASRAVRVAALKMILAGVVLVGGWFAYTQFLPIVLQSAFKPLAVRAVRTVSPAPRSAAPVAPALIRSVPVTVTPQELAERRRAESQAATELQRQKDHAWLAYYSAPASCEHPADWKAQVECGNQYMRAKKEFEREWLAEHGTGPATGAAELPARQQRSRKAERQRHERPGQSENSFGAEDAIGVHRAGARVGGAGRCGAGGVSFVAICEGGGGEGSGLNG